MPHIMAIFLSFSSSRKALPIRFPRLPPSCSAAPSRPTEAVARWLSRVEIKISGAVAGVTSSVEEIESRTYPYRGFFLHAQTGTATRSGVRQAEADTASSYGSSRKQSLSGCQGQTGSGQTDRHTGNRGNEGPFQKIADILTERLDCLICMFCHDHSPLSHCRCPWTSPASGGIRHRLRPAQYGSCDPFPQPPG